MIDLSPDELKRLFASVAVPGAIFYCENFIFDTGFIQDKFLLLLSADLEDDVADYLLATSKVARIRSIPLLSSECTFIAPSRVRCFTVETVFVAKDLQTRSVSHLINRFSLPSEYGKLEFRDMMPPDLFTKILDTVQRSRFVAEDAKQRIARSSSTKE